MNKFQLGLLVVFGLCIVIGVGIFAIGGLSIGGGKDIAKATVWGTIDANVFNRALTDSGLSRDKTLVVTYVQKDPATFDQEFVEALATGTGPDLFFLTSDSIVKHKAKIFPIPYENYSSRDFKTNFIEAGEVFLMPEGSLALPILIDPLVMYWNRDMFTNAGLAQPPAFWSEFYDLSTKLTKKDSNLNITEAAAPLGEFGNVTNSFEMLSLLLMQAGSSIVFQDSQGFLRNALALPPLAAERAVTFFTEFSNPLRPYYSWNRSLPLSKNFFLSGNLGTYFGFASELNDLRLKNPNLNFDVAKVPQSRDVERQTTYGKVTGLAIVKNSLDIAGAYGVATRLSGPEFLAKLSEATFLPPVRRDLLAVRPSQSFLSVFYESALQARTWPVPDPARTPLIFKNMVESITGGRSTISEAVLRAGQELDVQLVK